MLCFSGDGNGKHDVLFFFFVLRGSCVCFCFVFLCFVFFLKVQIQREPWEAVWSWFLEPCGWTAIRTVPCFLDINRFLSIKTVIVRGSQFFRLDRTVRSGFQNLDDRLEWHFIQDILELYRFPPSMINGGKLELFWPSRWIRQGDPLSPYLFIICIEMLVKRSYRTWWEHPEVGLLSLTFSLSMT